MLARTTATTLAVVLLSCATAGARSAPQAPLAPTEQWVTLDRGNFTIAGPSERIAILEDLAATAESNMPWIAESVGLDRVRPIRVVLVPSRRTGAESPHSRWLRSIAPEWAKGYAPPDTPFVAIYEQHWPNLDGSAPHFMRETLIHELAHVAIYQLGGSTLPKWLQEGTATWLSLLWRGHPGGYARPEHAGVDLLAARAEEDWWALHDQWGSDIYLVAGDFVSWLHALGPDAFRDALESGSAPAAAWTEHYGETARSLYARWIAQVSNPS